MCVSYYWFHFGVIQWKCLNKTAGLQNSECGGKIRNKMKNVLTKKILAKEKEKKSKQKFINNYIPYC